MGATGHGPQGKNGGVYSLRPGLGQAAASALAVVVASPYYMGMVFIFGLGMIAPLLFPFAVFTALSSKSRYSLFPLLVGPQVQLSVHYLVLAVGMGYVVRGELKR